MNRAEESSMRRRARGRDIAVAGGALAVVVAILGGSLIWGAAGAAFGRDAAISTAQVLGGSQARADRLPPGFPAELHGTGGIDPSTTRLLGVQAGTRYWIALDRSSNVCVVAQSLSSAELTAASCSSAGDLEARGASLRVEAGTWRLEAFLVPDSVDASSLPAPWSRVADNLVTYAGTGALGSIELKRDPGAPGAPVTLTREPGPAGR
jgi:hypothetical protein